MYEEVNFDGLVGPTHNYAGLSFGNVASKSHRHKVAHPKKAAIQGLKKMKALADLGVPQAVLPPLERPSIQAMKQFGFTGKSDVETYEKVARSEPTLLAVCCSASSMWTANATTVAPSPDTADGRLHLTPANLTSQLHRSLEAPETREILARIFSDRNYFEVHPPLIGAEALRDEGAANHTRLTPSFEHSGLHLFVHGDADPNSGLPGPKKFPARQARLAGECIARNHQLDNRKVLHLQQNPHAIDAGVFHNDVIAVGHCNLLFHHELAFAEGPEASKRLSHHYEELFGEPLALVEVKESNIDLLTTIRTYLFNTQLINLPKGKMLLIAPSECEENKAVFQYIESVVADSGNPIAEVRYFDLRESMQNGGGPACLRQRIVMNENERSALSARVILDDLLFEELNQWVNDHYREDLAPNDLADPNLLNESRTALDALTKILHLGSVYPFQKA